ncbi:MAG: hypothetical protein JW734_06565 [Candidatus Omnitrophica bacterium]|nr:hypothetical protein [Candidatus Omnitrophota bacterium]
MPDNIFHRCENCENREEVRKGLTDLLDGLFCEHNKTIVAKLDESKEMQKKILCYVYQLLLELCKKMKNVYEVELDYHDIVRKVDERMQFDELTANFFKDQNKDKPAEG